MIFDIIFVVLFVFSVLLSVVGVNVVTYGLSLLVCWGSVTSIVYGTILGREDKILWFLAHASHLKIWSLALGA